MVVNDEKAQFAERLNQACDLAGIPSGRGRRADLARMFNVSGESARKWLSGESIPKSSRVVQIALRLGVNGEWLLTGRGEMRQAESASPTPNTEPGQEDFFGRSPSRYNTAPQRYRDAADILLSLPEQALEHLEPLLKDLRALYGSKD